MKTMETMEAVSSDGMEKRVERRNWRQIAPLCRRKTVGEVEKSTCKSMEQEENLKNAYAGRGQVSIWEMSDETAQIPNGCIHLFVVLVPCFGCDSLRECEQL